MPYEVYETRVSVRGLSRRLHWRLFFRYFRPETYSPYIAASDINNALIGASGWLSSLRSCLYIGMIFCSLTTRRRLPATFTKADDSVAIRGLNGTILLPTTKLWETVDIRWIADLDGRQNFRTQIGPCPTGFVQEGIAVPSFVSLIESFAEIHMTGFSTALGSSATGCVVTTSNNYYPISNFTVKRHVGRRITRRWEP